MSEALRFLDPRVLARIDNLDLIARTVVDGFMAGLHQSPYLGVSTDFAEYRAYIPGDDVRRVDWRVYGRTDRLYVKEFEAETHADVVMLLDVSASMDWAGDDESPTKLDYARFLAACLGYFAHRQRDRVGAVTFDHDVRDQVPATGRQVERVLQIIARSRTGGAGNLGPPLARIARGLRRRGIVILLSDLYEDPETVRGAIEHLALSGNDVIVFHLLDPRELDLVAGASTPNRPGGRVEPRLFEDLETGERLPVIPERIGEDYCRSLAAHIRELGSVLGKRRIDYCQVDTGRPLDHALYDYLARRRRLQRKR